MPLNGKFPRYMSRTTCSSITLENCHIIIDIFTSQLKLRWQVKEKSELPLETSAVYRKKPSRVTSEANALSECKKRVMRDQGGNI